MDVESMSLSQPQVPSAAVPHNPVNLCEELLAFPEPDRASRWLKYRFEESPADHVAQVTAWRAYQNSFNGDVAILATEFVKLFATVFRTAEVQVTGCPQRRFLIKGVRPKKVPVKSQPCEAMVLQLQRWLVGRGLGMSPLATTNVAIYLGKGQSLKTLWSQLGSDPKLITAFVADSDDRDAAGDSSFTFTPGKLPISEDDSWRRGG